MVPKYHEGEKVMLAEFDNGCEVVPRQPGIVLSVDVMSWGVSYVVEVEPEEAFDDGLRELSEDQIEGRIGNGVVLH